MRIILQHQQLLDALVEIEALLADPEGATHCTEDCGELLDAFIAALQVHFAAEVTTTTCEELDSDIMARLQRLDAEHPHLLEAFKTVRRMALDSRTPYEDLRSALEEAARAFRKHEAEENVIFLDLF